MDAYFCLDSPLKTAVLQADGISPKPYPSNLARKKATAEAILPINVV